MGAERRHACSTLPRSSDQDAAASRENAAGRWRHGRLPRELEDGPVVPHPGVFLAILGLIFERFLVDEADGDFFGG